MSQQSWMDREFASTFFSDWYFWASPIIQHQDTYPGEKHDPSRFHVLLETPTTFSSEELCHEWPGLPDSWVFKIWRSWPNKSYPPGNGCISHLGKRKIIFKSAVVGNMLVSCRVTKRIGKRWEDCGRLTCMTCCSALSCVEGNMFNFLIWWTLYLHGFLVHWFNLHLATKRSHQPSLGGGVLGWQFFPGHSHETDTCRRSSGRLEGDVKGG